jgi:hypothetical protein
MLASGYYMWFEVLTTVNIKVATFCNVTPYTTQFVDRYHRFEQTTCLSRHGKRGSRYATAKIGKLDSSNVLAYSNETARRRILEDRDLV